MRNQLSDVPVRLQSLLSRKETYIAFAIGAILIIVPILISYSERTERLARAILNGHDETAIEMLIANPQLLNKRDNSNGFTPLHWAVISGRTNLVVWLAVKNAVVDATDHSGMTPLHKAAVFNRVTCAEILIAHGANVSALGVKYGALRLTPIHLAAEEGHVEMTRCLLEHGADVNSLSAGANRITPLHMAAAKGRTAVVETLIAAGADLNSGDCAKKTPLTWALESGQHNTADILRKAGAVP